MDGFQSQMEQMYQGIQSLQTMFGSLGKPSASNPNVQSPSLSPDPVSGVLGSKPPISPIDLAPSKPPDPIQQLLPVDPSPLGQLKVPKLDFPPFEGVNVRGWIQKANRYFLFNPIADHQKILFASLHLKGKADMWYQAHLEAIGRMNWFGFTESMRTRFAEDVYDNVVGEFSKLVQTGTVEEYHSQFEELQSLVLINNKGFSESYFVDCFVSGLKEEIRRPVETPVSVPFPYPFPFSDGFEPVRV
ncbi:hypothetical protein ACHQM5_017103 [Ranunculus cassubicifolius]